MAFVNPCEPDVCSVSSSSSEGSPIVITKGIPLYECADYACDPNAATQPLTASDFYLAVNASGYVYDSNGVLTSTRVTGGEGVSFNNVCYFIVSPTYNLGSLPAGKILVYDESIEVFSDCADCCQVSSESSSSGSSSSTTSTSSTSSS
tara:strand:- start:902 stop:1345 length:444 start_codon:yes stop_codon:yes gene_type:complete